MIDKIKKILKKYNCELLEYEFEYFPVVIGELDRNSIKIYIKFMLKNKQSFELNYVVDIPYFDKFINDFDKCVRELIECLD